jgi:hypothetical protein
MVYRRYRHIGPECADSVDAQLHGSFENTRLVASVAIHILMRIRMANIVGMRINRDHMKAGGNSVADARGLRWARTKNH